LVERCYFIYTPRDKSPQLQKAANAAQDVSSAINFAPAAAGGFAQGLSIPIRGIASLIPGETAANVANAPSFKSLVPTPQNDVEQGVQDVSELVGSLGPLGKMFGLLKGGAEAARVPKVLQNATALAGTGAIATPGDAFDKTLGAAGGLALGGAGKVASKVPLFLRGLLNDATPRALMDAIQKPHDILENTADQLYDYVRGAIKKRGILTPVKPEYLAQAEEILPKTRASKKLIDAATTGDYDAVHDLQSQLYKKGTAGMASDDIGLQNQGDEIIDLRSKINDDLKNHLIQTGNVDIAHTLEQGKGVFKKLMNTYFNKDLREAGGNGISKLVQSNLRIEPKNPMGLLDTTSKPMSAFLKLHPEAAKQFQGLQEQEAAKKALKRLLLAGGVATVGGGLTYGGKALYDSLNNLSTSA